MAFPGSLTVAGDAALTAAFPTVPGRYVLSDATIYTHETAGHLLYWHDGIWWRLCVGSVPHWQRYNPTEDPSGVYDPIGAMGGVGYATVTIGSAVINEGVKTVQADADVWIWFYHFDDERHKHLDFPPPIVADADVWLAVESFTATGAESYDEGVLTVYADAAVWLSHTAFVDATPISVFYVYRSLWHGDKKVLSAWGRYAFNEGERIHDVAVIEEDLWLLVDNGTTFYIARLQVPEARAQPGWPWPVHLDNRVELAGTYDEVGDRTTWTLPVADAHIDAIVLGPAFGGDVGSVLAPKSVSGTSVVIDGDYSAGPCQLGRLFEMSLTLSRPFVRDPDGAAYVDARLVLTALTLQHRDSGAYSVTAAAPGWDDWVESFSPAGQTEPAGQASFFIRGQAEDTTVAIASVSALPVGIVGGEWTGTFQRRAR